MEIREIRPDDYEGVGNLTVAAYRSAPEEGQAPNNLRPGGHFDSTYAPMLRDVALRARMAVVLVAERYDVVVGAVTYVPGRGDLAEFDEDDAAGIRHLAVDPAWQGRGVGRALVEACIERARTSGKRTIVLHTEPHMRAAQRLYRRLGFQRAPERDFRPVPDVELLAYVLDL